MKTSSANQLRVVATGSGVVSATFSYALAQGDLAEVVAVVDNRENLIQRQVLDLVYRQPIPPIMPIYLGNPSEHANSQSIVLTAGVTQEMGDIAEIRTFFRAGCAEGTQA